LFFDYLAVNGTLIHQEKVWSGLGLLLLHRPVQGFHVGEELDY
jgi:hypothetical protein